MTILLTCCKTHQSVIEKSMAIATDTTEIRRIAVKDSSSLNVKIDSIIIEEYAADDRSELPTVGQNDPGHKASPYQKRNDTSQKGTGSLKKKIKIYGANISGTWLSKTDSINKRMSHNQKTNKDIKQKTPIQTTAGGKKVYALIALAIILFVGYMFWKNAEIGRAHV